MLEVSMDDNRSNSFTHISLILNLSHCVILHALLLISLEVKAPYLSNSTLLCDIYVLFADFDASPTVVNDYALFCRFVSKYLSAEFQSFVGVVDCVVVDTFIVRVTREIIAPKSGFTRTLSTNKNK
jgi:hypothetical protein